MFNLNIKIYQFKILNYININFILNVLKNIQNLINPNEVFFL